MRTKPNGEQIDYGKSMPKNLHPTLAQFTKMHGGVRSIRSTLYWIEEALRVHSKEFSAEPGALELLEREGVDLLARLERLSQDVTQLKRDLIRASSGKGGEYRQLFCKTQLEDLSPEQLDRLAEVNARLDEVGEHVRSVQSPVESSLDEPLHDPANRMYDYEVCTELQFFRAESDPDYDEGGDNTISEIELPNGLLGPDAQWPDGYDDTLPFAHGAIFHQLRLYGNAGMNLLDYQDILKIGVVWVDLKVTYQYAFDLRAGKWIKHFDRDHEPQLATYVSE